MNNANNNTMKITKESISKLNKTLDKMKFWHIVKDSKGIVRESFIVSNSNKRYSLICSAEILGGTYEVITQHEIN